MLAKYKHQMHSKCPRCNKDQEDVSHVLQCNHNSAEALWDQEMKRLKEWMTDNNGEPDMIEAILENLQEWREQSPYLATRYENGALQKAICHQDHIGRQNFIEGSKIKAGDKYKQHI